MLCLTCSILCRTCHGVPAEPTLNGMRREQVVLIRSIVWCLCILCRFGSCSTLFMHRILLHHSWVKVTLAPCFSYLAYYVSIYYGSQLLFPYYTHMSHRSYSSEPAGYVSQSFGHVADGISTWDSQWFAACMILPIYMLKDHTWE